MEKDLSAQSGEILDDKKEKSKKKKSKVAEYISSRFAKLFSDREKPTAEATEANKEKLSLKGRLLELIGAETDKPQPSEIRVETGDETGPVERIRSALSSLNVFTKREADPQISNTELEADSGLEELTEPTSSPIEEPDLETGQSFSVAAQEASRETIKEQPNRPSSKREKEYSFGYFDKHEREHRKQKKHNEKQEKELEKVHEELDDIQKENEVLLQETEKTKRDAIKAGAQRTEGKAVAPQESDGRKENVEAKTPVQQSIEQSQNLSDNTQQSNSNAQELRAPSRSVDQIREEIVPRRQEPLVEKSPEIITEPTPAFVEKEQPVDSAKIVEKERLIERIINPETQETTGTKTGNEAANTTTGTGLAASTVISSIASEDQLTPVSVGTTKKLGEAEHRIEMLTVIIIAVAALVAFSLLAIVLLN